MGMLTSRAGSTRTERLGWDARTVIAIVRRSHPRDTGELAEALMDQLEEANVPREALEACIADWVDALAGLAPGRIPPPRMAQLEAAMRGRLDAYPDAAAYARWMTALLSLAGSAHDLHWVIQLLLQARNRWEMMSQVRHRDWRDPKVAPISARPWGAFGSAGIGTPRRERLAWVPAEAVERARRQREDRGAVAVAMIDQLIEAGVSNDALLMSVAPWCQAIAELGQGAMPAERLAYLDAAIAAELGRSPVLGSWLAALRRTVMTTQDADQVIGFLIQARNTWLLMTTSAAQWW